MLRLTAVLDHDESGWWQARVKELPEVITAAPTREEAVDYLRDAVREYLRAMLAEERPVPVHIQQTDEFELALV